MAFTYTERNGDKPIGEWLAKQIEEYANKHYGVDIRVQVKSNDRQSEESSPTPAPN
jgi:hypothetical protein